MKKINSVLVTSLVIGGVMLGGCSSNKNHSEPAKNTTSSTTQTSDNKPLPHTSFNKPVTSNMKPTNIDISSIKLNKPVRSLGLTDKGEISPPKGVVQWYNRSVTPGSNGISVIAGHVTYDDPDVFYNLEKVNIGDKVKIKYNNGETRSFKVVKEASIKKEDLQHDPRIWGKSKTPSLVLITCDNRTQLIGAHHVNNFVVWTVPEN